MPAQLPSYDRPAQPASATTLSQLCPPCSAHAITHACPIPKPIHLHASLPGAVARRSPSKALRLDPWQDFMRRVAGGCSVEEVVEQELRAVYGRELSQVRWGVRVYMR